MSTDAEIQAEIEKLRVKFTETPELYREVCTLLFFRHGITPTANKLYQFVRKGSMSAPAEALAKFWEDLRKKSRVRIEHPDLPDALKSTAGEMVAALWTQAQMAAQENMAAFRSDSQAEVQRAQAALNEAENARLSALEESNHARLAVQAAADRTLQLERDLAAERAGKAALVQQLDFAARQQETLEGALAQARHDFAAELEKLRQALQGSELRCEATEKRALLEIDRERVTAAKLQKELVDVRQNQQAMEARHRIELERLQTDLGATRQQLGVAEGMLRETQKTSQQQGEELQSLRKDLSESETRAILLEHDIEGYRKDVAKLEQRLAQQSIAPPSEREAEKPKRQRTKASSMN